MVNEKEIKKSDKKIDLSGFKMRDHLNPKVWEDDETMKTEVRKRLLKIADDYFEGLDLPGVDIEDVTMTGSLANYNWSKYSDVDLHIIIDYKDMPMKQDLVQDYLKSKSSSWNENHDIKIYGFDVEIYVQDSEEEHVSSGVYSLLRDEWNVKPEKKKISIKDKAVKNKANRVMDMIEDLHDKMQETDDHEQIVELADKVKDKIKKMRQCGLDKGGEFSVENMVFKILRRNGMLERLNDIKTVAYDKSMTLESINEENDLQWIDDFPINPFYEYDGVVFDGTPSYEEFNQVVEMLLSTGRVRNYDDWLIGREDDYSFIIGYIERIGNCLLTLNKNNSLTYSPSTVYNTSELKLINFSQMKKSFLKEENDLQWIEDVKPINPNLPFEGYEYWIDTSMLSRKESVELYNKINKVFHGKSLLFSSYTDVKTINGIVVHCGSEADDFIPTKHVLCFMPKRYDEDLETTNSLYVDGSILLDQYKLMGI